MNIYFDLDGTILNVYSRHYNVYKSVIRKIGGRCLDRNDYIDLKRNKTSLKLILIKSKVKDKTRVFRKKWLRLIERKDYLLLDKVIPGAKQKLKLLKKNHRLVLVSLRQSKPNLIWQLKKLKLLVIFDMVMSRYGKEGAQVKSSLIESDKEFSRNSCIVGDTGIDISTGKILKIKTYAVSGGLRNSLILKKYKPDFICSGITELEL